MDKRPLFPGACFDFHMGRGHGRKVNPSMESEPSMNTHPHSILSLHLSVHNTSTILKKQATVFRICHGELNLKTSPFSGFSSVLHTSLCLELVRL